MSRRAAALAALGLAAGCTLARPPTPAPPAAPAARPGFRAVTPDGVELVYDARSRSYAVSGRPGLFWLDGRYFREVTGGWETGPALDGPWRPCEREPNAASDEPSDRVPDCR